MIENKCKQCGNDIRKYSKFCNSSCAASFNNRNRTKKSLPSCAYCGKELGRRGKKYCSNQCQADLKKQETVQRYLNGEVSSRNSLRRLLKEERGNICNCCGISDWNNKPISLEVSHIDGNPYNDLPINLELICPNCHSQTDSFKGRNRGSGRKLRK